MAGSPPFGKMSTGMRCSARTAHRAIASNATTTVRGLESAASTRRMGLAADLGDERLDVAGRRGYSQQPAPDSQPGEGVVDLGLRQEALRIGHLIDGAETGLVAGGCL